MKTTYLLLTLLFSVSFLGQNTINNQITPDYQEIRGSKVSMIPPNGFKAATTFLGFQEVNTNSSVLVLDVPKSFAEVSSGLTTENLLKQRVLVEQSARITLNGLPAILIKGEQTVSEILFRKYILVVGTEKETIIINGIAPKSDLSLDEMIKTALLSTVYDANKVLTPLDSVDFEIDILGTDFVFAKNMSNMLVYNRDGKMPSELADKASFVIAKGFSKTPITDKKTFATNRIKALPVQVKKIISIVPLEINGLNGFEVTADGVNRKTGQNEQAYQVMLFIDDSYYILYGSSVGNFKNNLAVFKKLAQTFKQKE